MGGMGGCDCGWEVVIGGTFVDWVEVGGRLWVGLWLFVWVEGCGDGWDRGKSTSMTKSPHAWIEWVEVHIHD